MGKAFKLQSVLDYRNILEQQAQQQLAQTLRSQEQVLQDLGNERNQMETMLKDFEAKKRHGLAVEELLLYQSNIHHREQVIAGLQRRLEQLNQEILQRRSRLNRTCQDRQVLERLKSHHQQQQRLDSKRRETGLLDEIGLRSKEYLP